MVTIIDYDAGNIRSVEKAFAFLGEETLLSRDAEQIQKADRLVLPGVGSFGSAMERLASYGLVDPIRDAVKGGVPFLGICLGFQLLFSESEEDGGVEGLNILPGRVRRFPEKEGFKIPQIGWNSLSLSPGSSLFNGLNDGAFVYFVHSYYVTCDIREAVCAVTDYTCSFDSAVEYKNIFGCQFHPEKSSDIGLKILKNFL